MTANGNRTKELLDQLEAGIAQLTTSERWEQWLRTLDKFHAYSFLNTLAI